VEAKVIPGHLASAVNLEVSQTRATDSLDSDSLGGLTGSHAVTRDQADRDKSEPTLLDYMRHAQKRSGRGAMDLAREFFRLNRGPGKLTWPEYVQFGLYDKTRYSPEDQSRFITNTLHWPITHVCCDMTWQAATEDKWLCAHILARSAVREPKTLAVIDKTDRSYPETHAISTAENLRDFMRQRDVLPLFGKENRGICSFGAFVALEANEDALLLKGEGWIGYEAFLNRFVGETPYLLQGLESNHSFFDRYTDALATVRICILIDDGGIEIPFAILKLPSRDNVADSFWRPGNLACNLDVQSGKVLSVRSKDHFGTTDHTVHPETGAALLGETVPMWDRVVQMARDCAPIFQPLRYQSMDIAITPEGPVLIEVNTGGGFDLPQLASGEGFLTDAVREFFRSCGYGKI
jgi:Sugar-transfer associated ATP-grasp